MSDERRPTQPAANAGETPDAGASGKSSSGDIYSGRESHKKSLGQLTSRERIARGRRLESEAAAASPAAAEPVDLYTRDDHRAESEQADEARRAARHDRRQARKRRKRVRTAIRTVGIVVPLAVIALLITINMIRNRNEIEAGLSHPSLPTESEAGWEDDAASRGGSSAEEEMDRINRLRRAKEFELDTWRFIHAGDLESALEKVDAAVERCPDLVSLRFTRGKVLFDLGRYKEALTDLRGAVEGDPSSAAYFTALGACYLKLNDPGAAAVCLETAVSLDPELPETLSQLGYTWLQLGLEDRALEALQRAAALNPGDPGVLANLAEAELLRGWTERAISTSKTALDLDPGEPTALYALARAYGRMGSADNAVATLTLAYDRLGADSVAEWLGVHDFAGLRADPAFQQFSRWIAAESFRGDVTGDTASGPGARPGGGPSPTGLQLKAPEEATPQPTLRLGGAGQSVPRASW